MLAIQLSTELWVATLNSVRTKIRKGDVLVQCEKAEISKTSSLQETKSLVKIWTR